MSASCELSAPPRSTKRTLALRTNGAGISISKSRRAGHPLTRRYTSRMITPSDSAKASGSRSRHPTVFKASSPLAANISTMAVERWICNQRRLLILDFRFPILDRAASGAPAIRKPRPLPSTLLPESTRSERGYNYPSVTIGDSIRGFRRMSIKQRRASRSFESRMLPNRIGTPERRDPSAKLH